MALSIPEIVGNMIMEMKALTDMNEDFYKKHKEFKGHEQTVAAVLASMEDPLKDQSQILKEAPGKIRERINTMQSLDLKNVNSSPDTTFKSATFNSGNGEI